MKSSDSGSNKVLVVLTLCLISLIMWVLTYLSPMYLDDYWYKYVFFNEYFDFDRPITSFQDVLISQYYHYFGYNGRNVVHIPVQLFAGIWGKPFFNFMSAGMFAFFAYVITYLTTNVSWRNILFSSSVVFLLYPEFGATNLWMSGSVNYLWTSVVICLFLILFDRLRREAFRVQHLLWIVFGIVAGWTHEGVTFPLLISLCVYVFLHRKAVCRQASSPLVLGFMIGALICTFSPATISRAGAINIVSLLLKCWYGIQVCIALKACWVLFGTLFILWIVKKDRFYIWLKEFYTQNIILWNALLFAFVVVFIPEYRVARIGIGVELFAIILWLRMIYAFRKSVLAVVMSICYAWGGILCTLVLCYSIPNYWAYKDVVSQIACSTTDWIIARKTYPTILNSYILNPVTGFTGDAGNFTMMESTAKSFHSKRFVFVSEKYIKIFYRIAIKS